MVITSVDGDGDGSPGRVVVGADSDRVKVS